MKKLRFTAIQTLITQPYFLTSPIEFHLFYLMKVNESLLSIDNSLSSYKPSNNKKKKRLLIILFSIFSLIIIAGVILCVVFLVLKKKDKEKVLVWREVLRCRKDKNDKTSAMQMATLYNSFDGMLLCGGGSDIHEFTARPTLYRSLDDGETWKPVYVGEPDMFSLYAFQKLPNNDYIGIVPGYFIRSTDEGDTWNLSELANTGFSMGYNKDSNTLIVSKNSNDIYISHDYGHTFDVITYCPQQGCDNLRAISYAGNNTWYLGVGQDEGNQTISHARVFKSTNDGLDWEMILEITNEGAKYRVFFSVFAYSVDEVLVGSDGDDKSLDHHPKIYKTHNGGLNWTVVCDTYDFDPTIRIVRSFYSDAKTGKIYACLDCSYASSSTWADEPDVNKNSMVIVSEDRGETWKLLARTETKRLYWITQSQDGNFIASTGEYGQILKSEMVDA